MNLSYDRISYDRLNEIQTKQQISKHFGEVRVTAHNLVGVGCYSDVITQSYLEFEHIDSGYMISINHTENVFEFLNDLKNADEFNDTLPK